MIKNWIVTGDTHGRVHGRIVEIANKYPDYKPEETGIIILGDVGLNYYLSRTEKKNKKIINESGYTLFCVRGNHEQRPEDVPGMTAIYDSEVKNSLWIEEDFPNIKYLKDGHEYNFGGYYCLVIGGAYSIDKWWRLKQAAARGQSFSGWFENEQLNEEERQDILERVWNCGYDFVFTHTAPISWEPTDLFLSFVDQSTVDKTTEEFLESVKECLDSWGIWCFGHYHADRIEAPCVEQFYYHSDTLDELWNRWYGKPEEVELNIETPLVLSKEEKEND